MKRSRSRSFGNIRVLKPRPSTAFALQCNPGANASVISVHAPPKVSETERVGILTLTATKLDVWQESHFLDHCFFCKKRLCQYDERFMYGDFHAFCSLECRAKQIVVDVEKEKVSKQSTARQRQSVSQAGLI